MDVLTQFQQTIDDFLNSEIVQLGIRAVVIYVVLLWLATAFWAYRDMQQRTTNPVAPYLAATLIIVFTPILFLFAYFLYKILRPKETVAEANERALAEEAMLVEIESQPHCANCSRPVHEEWIICPSCRNRLRRVCPNCSRLVELDWSLCAWCGKDFERPELLGPAYMPQQQKARRGAAAAAQQPAFPEPGSVPAPALAQSERMAMSERGGRNERNERAASERNLPERSGPDLGPAARPLPGER
jgi:RNA polymerase subunit RPABC4/transcription elongation factor Spt4